MPVPERDGATSAKAFREELAISPARAAATLAGVHAADAVAWLQDVGEEDAWRVFRELDTEPRAALLEHADPSLRESLIARLSTGDLREIVEELPSDEAVDVLAHADPRVVEDVLEAMPDEHAAELRELAAHPPESAGGVMATEFIEARPGMRIGDVVKELKKDVEEAESQLGVFVVDDEARPVGYLSEHALLTNSIHTPIEDVMVEPVTVLASDDQEEAAQRALKYDLAALAVVDDQDGSLLGVISASDAREILEEEASEDFLRMVGTAPSLQTRLSVLTRVRQRMPLMAVTVGGGVVSAKILALFLPAGAEGSSSATILRYLPLIIGLAGNVGIQSSTILVRAFATGEVEKEREMSVLAGEVAVGLWIGLLCGGATWIVASWLETGAFSSALGGAVGAAVAAAVTWAAVLGCVVPMGCRRLGIDPAIVAGPFLICLSDVSGSAIYVSVARALLGG